jgi:hypothetical protein
MQSTSAFPYGINGFTLVLGRFLRFIRHLIGQFRSCSKNRMKTQKKRSAPDEGATSLECAMSQTAM